MNYPTTKYNKNGDIIYYKNNYGRECWREHDENNKLIHYKCSTGEESWFKWIDNNPIEITKEEFNHILFLKRKRIPRYEILDI